MDSTKVPPDLDEEETLSLNIVHHIPENVHLTFSDNIAIQHTPSEFTITFSQIEQPLVALASDFDKIETIKAEVVARIVLTPAKMVEFIKSIQHNWGMYQRRMKALVEAQNANTSGTENSPSPEE
jgi:hypothetical protein